MGKEEDCFCFCTGQGSPEIDRKADFVAFRSRDRVSLFCSVGIPVKQLKLIL